MVKTERKGFVMYDNYIEQVDLLTDTEAGKLFRALLRFSQTGESPNFDGKLQLAFSFMKGQIQRDAEKYADVCEKRREAGKKGGRPKKQPAADKKSSSEETNCFSEKAKKPNININENANVNSNANVNENSNAIVSVSSSSNVREAAPEAQTSASQNQQTDDDNKNIYFGNNVTLTKKQHRELTEKYGEQMVSIYISRVDDYIRNNLVRPYSNHYTTLCKWMEEDGCRVYNRSSEERHREVTCIDPEHSFDIKKILEHALYNNPVIKD